MAKKVTMNREPGFETLDITAPDTEVEVMIKHDGRVLWVNVDGRCVLRICQIDIMKGVRIEDNRGRLEL